MNEVVCSLRANAFKSFLLLDGNGVEVEDVGGGKDKDEDQINFLPLPQFIFELNKDPSVI